MKGMCRDSVSEMVWVYTDVAVWRYRPNEESRYFRCQTSEMSCLINSPSCEVVSFGTFPEKNLA